MGKSMFTKSQLKAADAIAARLTGGVEHAFIGNDGADHFVFDTPNEKLKVVLTKRGVAVSAARRVSVGNSGAWLPMPETDTRRTAIFG